MATVVAILEWLQKVDLVKWVFTIAIPTSAIWLFKWLWGIHLGRAAERKRNYEMNTFLAGLPTVVTEMIAETFIREETHTVRLPFRNQAVQLATELGIVTFVMGADSGENYYTLRGDIWRHLYDSIIIPRHMGKPSDQRAEKESDKK